MMESALVPKYFFTVRSPGGVVDDDKGRVLSDEANARDYARRVIRELNVDDGFTDRGFEIAVKDEKGSELFVIPFDGYHLQ